MSDILTQEEIDALLNAAPDIQRAAEEKPPAPAVEAAPATAIEEDLGADLGANLGAPTPSAPEPEPAPPPRFPPG